MGTQKIRESIVKREKRMVLRAVDVRSKENEREKGD